MTTTRRSFLAAACAGLVHAADADAVIDIHQHTNYSGRTDPQLLTHQRTMGISKTILLPAGSKYGLAADAGGNDTVVAIARAHPKQYVFFANKVLAQPPAPMGRRYSRERDSNVISVDGAVPVNTEIHERASIEDPARFFAEAFKARLAERGIDVAGPAMAAAKTSPAEIPDDPKELDAYPSPPLGQILAEMMRHDLALHAETAFKAMGRQAGTDSRGPM